jgi:hypothetical protein
VLGKTRGRPEKREGGAPSRLALARTLARERCSQMKASSEAQSTNAKKENQKNFKFQKEYLNPETLSQHAVPYILAEMSSFVAFIQCNYGHHI